jgi:acyl transferase domain-containing protein/acyl carrier protein
MSDSITRYSPDDIAIIGMAGRFPGASDLESFWRNLREGVHSISFFADEAEQAGGVAGFAGAGGVLADADLFDASFFGFTRREAEVMDPQQRVFLECAWEALESAGYDAERYEGRVGMYAGAGAGGYWLNVYENRAALESVGLFRAVIGNEKDHLATQVSYKLNLKGPAITVQTTCSTSLVAVSMACQSLLNYQCDMAMAGGVSISAEQKSGYAYEEGGILSPDGYCRAFDARARGTVVGNGAGLVVLKRMEDALADGDCIHAVIKGAAVNNDGSLKAGYTAPSVEGQLNVIAEALALAKVEPETITYVEAHGTGTALGDPIEVEALTQAFRSRTSRKGFCAIGSVKTNIGHLNTAAGVAGLIKTVLALKHRTLPPSLHFEQPNPQIDFADSPFYVNAKLSEWKQGRTPRRAGVSSFGIGGTNAHVVLEEAPAPSSSQSRRPNSVLPLSAKTGAALEQATANLAQYLKRNPHASLSDVGYTLQSGRRVFEHRRMLVCRDVEEAVRALEAPSEGRTLTSVQEHSARPVVMMFPGQGTQHVNMGRELYLTEPTFREQVDLCAELLKPQLGLDVRDVLYPAEGGAASSPSRLDQTCLAQPSLFVVEYALARLWMEWGVRPAAMIGHSIGEYVAACLAGVLTLEDALSAVVVRGRLMQGMAEGSMLALRLGAEQAQALVEEVEGVSTAAVNSPSLCVVSGRVGAIEKLEAICAERGLEGSRLHTSHAFHSEMMEPMLSEFGRHLGRLNLNPPRIPYLSNVTGTWITAAEAIDPAYWVNHLRRTVRFADGVAELLRDEHRVFLEVGPGRSLGSALSQAGDAAAGRTVLASMPHPRDRQADTAFILHTLGALWSEGAAVDWAGFQTHEQTRRLPLPTYPFERQRYWLDRGTQDKDAPRARQSESETKREADEWFYTPVWEQTPRTRVQAEDAGMDDAGMDDADEKLCRLVFVDEGGFGARLAQRLESAGDDVFTVRVGDEFEHAGRRAYVVNPRRPADYLRLLDELRRQEKIPARAVHLWGLNASGTRADIALTPAQLEEAAAATLATFDGSSSLFLLAQALAACNVNAPLRVEVITNNVYDITGEEALCPTNAMVLGAAAALPHKFPNVSCRGLDIIIPEAGSRAEAKLIERLVEEFATTHAETPVAYRGNHRWTRSFKPVRLDASTDGTPLRAGGVYLLTGGLRDIDLALGQHLAETVGAKLVFVSDEEFPRPEEWEHGLRTCGADESVGVKLRSLNRMLEAGAEVFIVEADVTRPEQAQFIVAQALERFGKLDGVLHTYEPRWPEPTETRAGEGRDAASSKQLKATLALHSAVDNLGLDFFLLFSLDNSVGAMMGDVDYCAAGAFLDAFAHFNASRRGRPTVTIDWGLKQREADAHATRGELPAGVPPSLRRLEAEQGISLDERVEAVRRVLAHELPQVVVSPYELTFARARMRALAGSIICETAEPGSESESKPRKDYVSPSTPLEQTIADLWQELFGVESVGVHDNFFDLGGNSLLGIQLMSRLRKTFLLELPMNNLYESPTVAGLAAAVAQVQVQEKEREELELLLKEIESLPDDELEARLAAA